MGGWAVAQSPILGTTITLQRLKRRGYIPLIEMYEIHFFERKGQSQRTYGGTST
ncbi:MAG: hypothetical protein N4A72_20870 [Bacteroidales bacterium]|jgi:hypothetical protein|nr:hypothetical protein [Bacteroidales bacterium]